MRMMCIASGSSGNCTYIGSDHTHILVDDGISMKRVKEGLNQLELDPSDLSGIFITHEHSDHISGLRALLKKYQIPVYATAGTIAGILNSPKIDEVDPALFNVIARESNTPVGDLEVQSFRIYHDANEPCAYTVSDGCKKAGVLTDLGHYDDYIIQHMKGVNSLVLESNHDVHMVEVGPYPYYLKQRILGANGHLSNESSGKLLDQLLHPDLSHIFLGHLSAHNNYEDLAFETVRLEVNQSESEYKAEDFRIQVARPDTPIAAVSF
ncbi:MAG: MBL fold metallo-hydrolase [Lachnospiraceae bacterium]|nr:MBL fold metallo-hydrolase [Lachnospiraceae bacterium]